MFPRRISSRAPGFAAALAAALLSFGVHASAANPVFGFREDWSGTSTSGWIGGGASGEVIDNPGTGGTFGAGDGYLRLTLSQDGNFGVHSTGAEYIGDWTAASIELVRLWLNDVGNADAFEIHFCIGNASNLWQYDTGFVPPHGAWQEFPVELGDPSRFTQIVGTGTFQQALQFADRIMLRHDRAPFVQTPDFTHGDLGIDRIYLTAVATRARQTTWGRIKRLYR